MRGAIRGLARVVAWLVMGLAFAQQESERLESRVIATGTEARVVIDRGARDGLTVGDLVRFHPRGGGSFTGRVERLDDRSATVDLRGQVKLPPGGTRAVVFLRGKRRPAEPEPPPAEEEPPSTPEEESATAPEEAQDAEPVGGEPPPVTWERGQDGWTAEQPLLAEVDAVLPRERALLVDGRWYLWAEGLKTLGERSDSFVRFGTDVHFTNPFGSGGELHLDLEANRRKSIVPDDDDERVTRLRLDRLSYSRGGDRFAADRFEVGRFLQQGMPEFGVLDGFEWGTRTREGHRWGYSIGFLPEPTPEQDTLEDFQVGAYYQHAFDREERLVLGAGLQKTLHHGSADRDLLVARADYLPREGWQLNSVAWIDFYGSDRGKGTVELTQLFTTAHRRYESGDTLDLTYAHVEFPAIERYEPPAPTARRVREARSDRLTAAGRHPLGRRLGVHGLLGGWDDEDESGGDVELGLDREGLLSSRDHADITAFASLGEFSTSTGAWLSYGRSTDLGSWDVSYEFVNHKNLGFSPAFDDIPQHRLRFSEEWYWGAGWSLALHGDVSLWDEEQTWGAGFFLQRSFQ